jgi:hypothetical protein
VAVGLLAATRADPARRAVVAGLAGDLAPWITELFPAQLAPRGRPGTTPTKPETLQLPEEIAALVGLAPQDLAAAVVAGLAAGHLANRHRGALVNLISTLTVDHLTAAAEALPRADANPNTMGLALSLADLAAVRLRLIRETTPS